MTKGIRNRFRWQVLGAAGVVAVLGGLLAVRLIAETGAERQAAARVAPQAPPAATVPAPRAAGLSSLSFPCWACQESADWPIQFRTDLDLLAPLGNGPANAGLYFKDFAKPNGSRFAEADAAMNRRVDGPSWLGKVLPPGDPLLLEAEPWCDQATMRFYPEFFPLEGWETQLPNLMVPLTLARSWVARGLAAEDPGKAMADFRRAIRLGRLVRQEGTTLIADLVGLACIRAGADGIYRTAVRKGEASLALTASIVLSEYAPQKLLSSERVTKVDLSPYLRIDASGDPSLSVPDAKVTTILDVIAKETEMRFRGEAILTLGLVRFMGTDAQKAMALAKLEELSVSTDQNVATLAKWSKSNKPEKKLVLQLLEPLPK
ncbi:MAG: hypothetical protein IT186_06890 [Acidobacteria bacterium]|nr:hypothetical protein [Acidobacteriota bacterium]